MKSDNVPRFAANFVWFNLLCLINSDSNGQCWCFSPKQGPGALHPIVYRFGFSIRPAGINIWIARELKLEADRTRALTLKHVLNTFGFWTNFLVDCDPWDTYLVLGKNAGSVRIFNPVRRNWCEGPLWIFSENLWIVKYVLMSSA